MSSGGGGCCGGCGDVSNGHVMTVVAVVGMLM